MEKYKVIHNRMGLVVDPVIQNVGRLEFEDELRVAELRTPTQSIDTYEFCPKHCGPLGRS